jgi:hypothetical protein
LVVFNPGGELSTLNWLGEERLSAQRRKSIKRLITRLTTHHSDGRRGRSFPEDLQELFGATIGHARITQDDSMS